MTDTAKPQLSVVVPLYNAEEYTHACFDNIAKQAVEGLEIIVVNDCSPDKSAARVREWVENNPEHSVRILDHSVNRGASTARNTGLQAALGEYVTFVDSDDLLAPDALSAMLGCAHLYDADIVVGGIGTFRYEEGEIIRRKYSGLEQAGVFQYALHGKLDQIPRAVYSVSAWAKLYKKSFLSENQLSFETHLRYAEDHLFVISAMEAAEMITIHPEVVYEYRIDNTSSVMSQRSNDYFDCIADVIPRNLAKLDGWPLYYYSRRVLDYELFQNLQKTSQMPVEEAHEVFSILRSIVSLIEPATLRSFIQDNPKFRLDSSDLLSRRFRMFLARHKARNVLTGWI